MMNALKGKNNDSCRFTRQIKTKFITRIKARPFFKDLKTVVSSHIRQ